MGSQDEQGTSRPALIKKSPSLSTIKEKSDTTPEAHEDVTAGCSKGKSIRRSNNPISNPDSDSDSDNENLDMSDIAPLEEEEYKVFSKNPRYDNSQDEPDSEESMLCTEDLMGPTQSLMQLRNDDDLTDGETPKPIKQNLEAISEAAEKSPNAIKNEQSSNLERSTTDISIANEAEKISSKIDNFNDISFDLDPTDDKNELVEKKIEENKTPNELSHSRRTERNNCPSSELKSIQNDEPKAKTNNSNNSVESVEEIKKDELVVTRKSQRGRRPSAKIKEIQSDEVMENEKHINEDQEKAKSKSKFQKELVSPSTTTPTAPNKSELKRSLENPKIEIGSKKPKVNTNLETDKIEVVTKSSEQVNEDNKKDNVDHIDKDKIELEIQSSGPRRSSRAKRPSAKLKELQEENVSNKRKSTEITQTEVISRNSNNLKQQQALPQNNKKRSKNIEVDIEMANRESVPKSTIELEPSQSKKVVIPNMSIQKDDKLENVEQPNRMSGTNLEKTLQIKIDKLVLPVEMDSTSTTSNASNNGGLKRSKNKQQTEPLSKKPKIEEVETVNKQSGRVNRKSNSANPKTSQLTIDDSVPKQELEEETTKRSVRASRSRSSNTKNMVESSNQELKLEDLKPKQGGRRSRASSSNSNVTEKSKSLEETTKVIKIELESKSKRGGTRSRASSSNSNSKIAKDITEKSSKMKEPENEVNPVVKTTRKSEPVPKKVSRTSSRSRMNSNASPVKKDGRSLSVIVGKGSNKISIITFIGHKHFKPSVINFDIFTNKILNCF